MNGIKPTASINYAPSEELTVKPQRVHRHCKKCPNENENLVYEKTNICFGCRNKEVVLATKKFQEENPSFGNFANFAIDVVGELSTSATTSKQTSLSKAEENSRVVFFFDLLKLLKKSNNSNVIVSPSSIMRILVVLSLGASGATKETLLKLFDKINITVPEHILSVTDSIEANDSLLTNYLARIKASNTLNCEQAISTENSLVSANSSEEAWLESFNAVLTAEGLPLSEGMKKRLTALNAVSGDQILSSSTLIEDLNEIFHIKTKGNVDEIVKQEDISGGEIVLLNAIYFAGKWHSEFKLDQDDMLFSLSADKAIEVKYMSKETTDYIMADFGDWQAIRLFYKGGKYAMDIILPPRGVTTEDNNINSSVIISKLTSLLNYPQNFRSREKIKIQMPLFSFSSKIDLLDVIQQHPDLQPLSSRLNLNEMIEGGYNGLINKAIQKCYIDVNEKGTTAKALTLISKTRSCSHMELFWVNRPFYFSLINTQTHDIAMAGFIQDPSANE